MAKPSSRSLSLFFALILGIVLCILTPQVAADSKDNSQICSTQNPHECYPRVFVPTDEFQVVREGQEIPPGLHVRLNIWTGEKEAKINVPGETDGALEGMPVDHGIVVVDPQPEDDEPKIAKNAPKYEPVGKVKAPQVQAKGFADAIKMLKTGLVADENTFDGLLEELEELSHDIFYGLQITEDTEATKALFCLMADQGAPTKDGHMPTSQQAATVLASSLQNNPTALNEIAKNWDSIMQHKCPRHGTTIHQSLYDSLLPLASSSDSQTTAQDAARIKSKVGVFNGLIKNKEIRQHFLTNGGMKYLSNILAKDGKEWVGAQRKIGQLALDNFLDEDMGAELGQWPIGARTDAAACQSSDAIVENCWDHHVDRIAKQNKGDKSHWSRDLSKRLALARKTSQKAQPSVRHEEL